MKLKISDIYNMVDGFNELVNKEMPISLALKIKRNVYKINEEINLVNEMKEEILSKYNRNSEDEEEYQKAYKEIEELDSQEINIDLQTIDLMDLENSDITIKTTTLISIEKILTESENEE